MMHYFIGNAGTVQLCMRNYANKTADPQLPPTEAVTFALDNEMPCPAGSGLEATRGAAAAAGGAEAVETKAWRRVICCSCR